MSDICKSGSCDFEQRVNHIKCEVTNCAYHGEQDCCHADVIEVTPHYAECETDTACSTFKLQG